jgi:hypothetical protein
VTLNSEGWYIYTKRQATSDTAQESKASEAPKLANNFFVLSLQGFYIKHIKISLCARVVVFPIKLTNKILRALLFKQRPLSIHESSRKYVSSSVASSQGSERDLDSLLDKELGPFTESEKLSLSDALKVTEISTVLKYQNVGGENEISFFDTEDTKPSERTASTSL